MSQTQETRYLRDATIVNGPVACLGMTFESEEARRAYFREKLREKLRQSDFRQIEGCPIGEDEEILALSDPPYYTACPNPFLSDFVRYYGKPYDPQSDNYRREPFAADVSEGKNDPIYNAHAYHTKVPHRAIMRYLLHYTEPGDLVLDGFAGSGMTGVAAQRCGDPDPRLKQSIEEEWQRIGSAPPRWGARRAVLNDLAPAATFIAANYMAGFDEAAFGAVTRELLEALADELGWMYETLHVDGKTRARINYTVWSDVRACSQCGGEIVFFEAAFDLQTHAVRETLACPHCGTRLTRARLERRYETTLDAALGRPVRYVQRRPLLINYSIGKTRFEKRPDRQDLELLGAIASLEFPSQFPTSRMMHAPDDRKCWGDNWRAGTANFTHVHQLFLPRARQFLACLWAKAAAIKNQRLKMAVLFWVEQALWTASLLNRYRPTGYSQVNQYMSGILRILAQHAECSPWYILGGKRDRLMKALSSRGTLEPGIVSTGSGGSLPMLGIEDNTIDYVFTDPPFGDNLSYSELNFIAESFHRVFTNPAPEAIISPTQEKALPDYQHLMQHCFQVYYRVLKPGRWMTVVFHNSRSSVWNAIQEAILAAGFVVADVRTLDKKQGSYNQGVAPGSVKQDLVISAFRPHGERAERFKIEPGTADGAWEFVRTHLRQLPVCAPRENRAEVVAERQAYLLFDRMVAFHVERGVSVPLSAAEFYAGLRQRFPERDGRYFLPDQVAEYTGSE